MIIALALALALQEPPTTTVRTFDPARAYDGTPAAAARIRGEIADLLRDPPSAYFRDVRVMKPRDREGPFIVCGRVSGRNGYGGMTQSQGFFYSDSPTITPEGAIGEQIWNMACKSEFFEPVESVNWNSSE